MQYTQEHLKTMVYAKFGGQTEVIMGNWKIENCMTGFHAELSLRAITHNNCYSCAHLMLWVIKVESLR